MISVEYAPSFPKRAEEVRISSVPPSGMASRALTPRFMMICSSSARSASTGWRPDSTSTVRTMSSPSMRRSIAPISITTSFRSRGRGSFFFRRLTVRSWSVRPVARFTASPIISMSRFCGASSSRLSWANSEQTLTICSTLLKSWAMPPARRPTASIRCANCNSSVTARWAISNLRFSILRRR